jgi:HEAT repeat protein
MSGLLDFVLKAEAAQEFDSPEALGSFFALFHAALSVLVFVLQSTLVGGSLRKLGIAGTIAILPSGVVLGGVLSVAVPRLWTIAVLTALENLLRNSLFRSGYELLYTPIDKARKRALKTIIDVGFDRLGDVTAAGLVMLCLALLPGEASRLVVGGAVIMASAGLLFSLRLHRGYVDELAQSLRTGTVSVTDVKGLDATTKQTLNDATLAIDRQQLLDRIRELHAQKDGSEAPQSQRPAHPDRLSPEQQSTLDSARTLLLDDEQELRQLLDQSLQASRLDPLLIPLVLPLLGRRHLARLALSVLQEHCRGREGILIDALLDHELPEVVRRRIPRILRELGSPRARDGLLAALDDDNLGVRYYSAQALFRLVANHPELAPDQEHIFHLVDRETKASSEEWSRPLSPTESDSFATAKPSSERQRARVEYAFLLLGTVLESEPLELCLKAVASGDATLRGTALEYLENVLPARLHGSLARHLGGPLARKRSREERRAKQIVQDLHQSMVNMHVDLDLYRKEPTSDEP